MFVMGEYLGEITVEKSCMANMDGLKLCSLCFVFFFFFFGGGEGGGCLGWSSYFCLTLFVFSSVFLYIQKPISCHEGCSTGEPCAKRRKASQSDDGSFSKA